MGDVGCVMYVWRRPVLCIALVTLFVAVASSTDESSQPVGNRRTFLERRRKVDSRRRGPPPSPPSPPPPPVPAPKPFPPDAPKWAVALRKALLNYTNFQQTNLPKDA